MKSLKEYICEGLLDRVKNKEVIHDYEEELKHLHDQVRVLKNYKKRSKSPIKDRCDIEIENLNNLLKFMGYDADSIHIEFYLCHGSPGWSLVITLLYHDDRGYKHDRIEFRNTILDEKISKISDMIKILKDATKDVKTFQKFLENMKSYKVDASNIIKVI